MIDLAWLPERTPAKVASKDHLKKAKGKGGRPKHTWIRQINNDLEPINKTADELIENEYERKKWTRTVTEELMSSTGRKRPKRRRKWLTYDLYEFEISKVTIGYENIHPLLVI